MWTLYVLPLQQFRGAKDLDTWNIFQANVGKFVRGLSNLLCLFTFRFNSSKSNRPRRVLEIVILIASGRIVQSHDCYKGKTRSKIDFLMCGANIFLQIPVLYVFSRVGFFFFFFFYFNWRLPLSVFNSRAIFCCAPNKNGAWRRDDSVNKTYMRVSHRQLACKHCNFQSSMFLSSCSEKRCISAWEEFSRQVLETAAFE